MLVEATARNAPVQRFFLKHDRLAWLSSSISTVPFVVSDESEAGPATATPLVDQLQRGVESAYRRARNNGWEWFRDGRYRQAARAFESAAALEPADFEARIGGLFSYVSIGAMRTSMVLLDQLCRRDPNPLGHDLNMREFYEDPMIARQVDIRTRLLARASGGVAEATALHAFVLWYLGEREEARAVAANLARDHAESPYVHWARLMEAAERSGGDG